MQQWLNTIRMQIINDLIHPSKDPTLYPSCSRTEIGSAESRKVFPREEAILLSYHAAIVIFDQPLLLTMV